MSRMNESNPIPPIRERDIVEPPSERDAKWLRQAEDHVLHLLRSNFRDVSLDHSEADFALVQRALDKKVVRRRQVLDRCR